MVENKKPRLSVDLSGRVALVTGAARGIGFSIAECLSGAGAKVACVDINAEVLTSAVESLEAAGGEAIPLECDVSNSEQVTAVVREAVERFGGLDILVNNAGITRDGLVMRMKDEQWDQVLGINLRGVFLFTRAAARPLMKSAAGRIINVASVCGLAGNPGQANYSASKAGVIGFTRTVAGELASRGVTVNAIAPGFIQTEMTAALDESQRASIEHRIPLCRLGVPLDVGETVLFLASDAASYITGQVLAIDGGMTASL